MGTQLHPPRGARQPSPIFSAHVYCGQTVGRIRMPLGVEVGLGPGSIVLDRDPASPPTQRGIAAPTPFSAHVYCGQTVALIGMLLGVELGLGLGDVVLDGDLGPPHGKGHSSPTQFFGPCLLWPNDWSDRGVTWYRGRLRPK